ncbi:MAG: M23 family metallopeptidase [Planctomycetota bacterium]
MTNLVRPAAPLYPLTHFNPSIIALIAVVTIATPAAAQLQVTTKSGAPARADACISATERANARLQVDAYFAQQSAPSGAQPFGPAITPYLLQPIGGQLYQDVFNMNFYDLDATTGLLDWDCTAITYDGHDGVDIGLRSFGQQDAGVPVFAALPGTVIATHDGEVDTNTCGLACTTLGNSVIIDHGNGRVGYYWHLRNGSVAVTPGASVAAGQQIGLVGSSGLSTGPHLHLGTEINGTFVEPYVGLCHPGTSLWLDQPPIDRSFYLFDHGFTPVDLTTHPGSPQTFPRLGEYAVTDGPLTLWFLAANIGVDPPFTLRVRRPNGTVAGIYTGNLSTPAQLFSWHWLAFDVPEMHTLLGNWRIQLLFGTDLWIDSFVEVVPAHGPVYNDPPNAVTLLFEPAAPVSSDALQCKVGTNVLDDDPDFDIVRYNYVWSVDGVVVRDVTHAALADVLAQGQLVAANSVACTVTPSDGTLTGPSTTVDYNFGSSFQRGDCNADGSNNLSDPIFALTALFNNGPAPTCADACDSNDDGSFNLVDAIVALNALFGIAGALPAPATCGADPTEGDGLDCAEFAACP